MHYLYPTLAIMIITNGAPVFMDELFSNSGKQLCQLNVDLCTRGRGRAFMHARDRECFWVTILFSINVPFALTLLMMYYSLTEPW